MIMNSWELNNNNMELPILPIGCMISSSPADTSACSCSFVNDVHSMTYRILSALHKTRKHNSMTVMNTVQQRCYVPNHSLQVQLLKTPGIRLHKMLSLMHTKLHYQNRRQALDCPMIMEYSVKLGIRFLLLYRSEHDVGGRSLAIH